MDAALLVDTRQQALHVAQMDMQCDLREIPESPNGATPVGWWLAGTCLFSGSAFSEVNNGQLAQPQEAAAEGTAAIAVSDDRVLGIVSPNRTSLPALWWAWSLANVEVETKGVQGLFKKRPSRISLINGDDIVDLGSVSRLYRNSGRHQGGQEASLIEALRQ